MNAQIAQVILDMPYPLLLALMLAMAAGGVGLIARGLLGLRRRSTRRRGTNIPVRTSAPGVEEYLTGAAIAREDSFRRAAGGAEAIPAPAQESLPDRVVECAGEGMEEDESAD